MTTNTQGKSACRKAFSDRLCELAAMDPSILAITTDARESVTLAEFARRYPAQFIEVGIAEQNAIGIAAGLALSGKKPFVCGPAAFYSTRSFEQIKNDVAYSGANVKVIAVSGGLSYGALGSTHHSLHDIASIRAIPGVTIVFPCDAVQTRLATSALARCHGPVYMRMGRAEVPDVYPEDSTAFKPGFANLLSEGDDLTLIGTGETVHLVRDAAVRLRELGKSALVLDMHTLKPIDESAVTEAAQRTGAILTVEEHSVYGGLGGIIAELVATNHPVPMKIMGVRDEFAPAGSQAELFRHYHLTVEHIVDKAMRLIARKA